MVQEEPNVILQGGPAALTIEERLCRVSDLTVDVKMCRGNRYEHFEPTAEVVESERGTLRVFRWTGCTHVAE